VKWKVITVRCSTEKFPKYLVAVPLSTGLGTRLVACSLAPTFIAVNPIFSVRSCNTCGILGLQNPQSQILELGKLVWHCNPCPGGRWHCDPILHVSSHSGEACCELLYSVYLTLRYSVWCCVTGCGECVGHWGGLFWLCTVHVHCTTCSHDPLSTSLGIHAHVICHLSCHLPCHILETFPCCT